MSDQFPNLLCIGIDPGSSKSWATWEIEKNSNPIRKNYRITTKQDSNKTIDQLIDRIMKFTDEGVVILAIDAPICVPNGTDEDPMTADKFDWKEKQKWPFNVNHFSTRPCERALASKIPETGDALVKATRKLSISRHSGVSVMGYQRTPHGPIVRAFVKELKRKLEGSICFDPEKARDKETRKGYKLFILESHPAVSLALWTHKKEKTVEKYKGKKSEISCNSLLKFLPRKFSKEKIGKKDDDGLDALVSAINAYQLVDGEGDWFGTYEAGYFLIPNIRGGGKKFSELWKNAAKNRHTG